MARQTKLLKNDVLQALFAMTGPRQRCMYCSDSHGTDIEHWRPKSANPQLMFVWSNLLLCCTECGRIKFDKFPVDAHNHPLLIDPCQDDPWTHLDFDPLTGILSARYDLKCQAYDLRGETTVKLLQFELRESMQQGFRRSWKRIAAICEVALTTPMHPQTLVERLREADEHDLIAWCFSSSGAREPPFDRLLLEQGEVFRSCRDIVDSRS